MNSEPKWVDQHRWAFVIGALFANYPYPSKGNWQVVHSVEELMDALRRLQNDRDEDADHTEGED